MCKWFCNKVAGIRWRLLKLKLYVQLHKLTMSCKIRTDYKDSIQKIFLVLISTLPHFQAALSGQIRQDMERDRPG